MTKNNSPQDAVYTSLLPAKKSERLYGTWDLIFVQICFGIAAWFFLTGSQAGVLLPAYQAIPVVRKLCRNFPYIIPVNCSN